MSVQGNDLSDAIALYFGLGTSRTPQRDRNKLIARFGVERAAELEAQIYSLIMETAPLEGQLFKEEELGSAMGKIRAFIQARHPQITNRALDAFEWALSWTWR
jgi:hypothetical protein